MRLFLGLPSLGVAMLSAQGAFAQADFGQLFLGSGTPLAIHLKDLDSKWRVFTTSTNSYAGLLAGMMGGMGGANNCYTKGDTIKAGDALFLIVYKPASPNLATMIAGGGHMPQLPAVTGDTELHLSLLNLHEVTEIENIHPFDLSQEISAGQKSIAELQKLDSATTTAPAQSATASGPSAAGKSPLSKGAKAPDFRVYDANNNPVRLSSYRGKVVVLDFWATWCGPCQESLPSTNEVAAKYAKKNVVFLAVNVWDTKQAFKDWLPKHKNFSSLKFAIDTAGQGKDVATKLYNVEGIPTQYVIDRHGRVVGNTVGYDGNDNALVSAIKKALNTN